MIKRPRTLTAAFVRTVSRPGVYGDGRGGRGLSLRVHRTVDGRITKTWRQRFRIEGRLTSIGLGPYPEVMLAEARHRIATVFRWCIGRNYRRDNPVDRAVAALPKGNGSGPRHHRALPHREVAAALRALRRTRTRQRRCAWN